MNPSYKPTHDMISGALSGFFSKMVVYPFDLVRKRLQMEGSISASTYLAESTTWYTCLKNIIKHEGYRSLYKGLAPSLLKVAPANAVTFMVFEETKDLLIWLKKDDQPVL
jgi:solute carrier family 25 thiamine pyrophosphate transporter 19